jgi:hypothetical protein
MVCYRAMMGKSPLIPMHHPIEEGSAIPVAECRHHYEGQLLKGEGEADKPLLWREKGIEIIVNDYIEAAYF